jgi:Domain of unknown function (DUF4349)
MSQRDLVAEVRAARTHAPAEVRERVRLIAAQAPEPRRRFTWRRALVVVVPAAAAVAAAAVLLPSHGTKRAQLEVQHGAAVTTASRRAAAPQEKTLSTGGAGGAATPFVPQGARSRVQRIGTQLSLRADSPAAVSSGVKWAQTIVTSLGGYVVSVHATSHGRSAVADLTLKVPRVHVQTAVARLSQLGTITAEQLDVQDETAGINVTNREIARLQRELRDLRAQEQTDAVKRRIAALTARVEALQRSTAATKRAAHFATVDLHLATAAAARHVTHHGPFHWLGRAFVWAGVGLVYALAFGVPLAVVVLLAWLATRAVRRRREEALLSRP